MSIRLGKILGDLALAEALLKSNPERANRLAREAEDRYNTMRREQSREFNLRMTRIRRGLL